MTFRVWFVCFLFGDIWNIVSFHLSSISWFMWCPHLTEHYHAQSQAHTGAGQKEDTLKD